jgi:basic amino acid/polyamine antiporter, APA family
MSTVKATSERLPRTLGLWSAIAIVIGVTIGSGVFRSPAAVARGAPQPWAMIGLWAAGGLVSLCGALSIAELAAARPQTGGFYTYLRDGWGRPFGFLFGWAQLVVIRATALGGVALVFGEYLGRSLNVDPLTHPSVVRVAAALAIGTAAAANIAAVRTGAALVNASSAAKFVALGILVLAAFVFGGAHGGSLAHLTAAVDAPTTARGVGLGLVSVLWAYDGFADVVMVSGEVKDPHRALPRALVSGTLAIITIYILANMAYLYVLPAAEIGRSPLVAADAMTAIFGRPGAVLVSLLVAISTFGSLNGQMLASPRIFFAMADDGLLFAPLAKVHPRFKTPHVAILLAAALGILLVLSQTFETLTNTFVLAIWPFYALSVAAVYRQRRLNPDRARPYEVVGYPVVPAIFILSVVWFVANAFITDPVPTGLTFALIGAGIPVYFLFVAGNKSEQRP